MCAEFLQKKFRAHASKSRFFQNPSSNISYYEYVCWCLPFVNRQCNSEDKYWATTQPQIYTDPSASGGWPQIGLNTVTTQAQRGKGTVAHRFLPDLQISKGTSNIEHPSASQARALRAGRTSNVELMNAPLAQLILYKLMERSDTLTLGTLIYFRHFRHWYTDHRFFPFSAFAPWRETFFSSCFSWSSWWKKTGNRTYSLICSILHAIISFIF